MLAIQSIATLLAVLLVKAEVLNAIMYKMFLNFILRLNLHCKSEDADKSENVVQAEHNNGHGYS